MFSADFYWHDTAFISFFVAAVTTMAFKIIKLLRTVFTARVLHHKMLSRVLQAPMTFFDTTPVGRIVNRFSSVSTSLWAKITNRERLSACLCWKHWCCLHFTVGFFFLSFVYISINWKHLGIVLLSMVHSFWQNVNKWCSHCLRPVVPQMMFMWQLVCLCAGPEHNGQPPSQHHGVGAVLGLQCGGETDHCLLHHAPLHTAGPAHGSHLSLRAGRDCFGAASFTTIKTAMVLVCAIRT